MNLFLTRLSLRNFKGVIERDLPFTEITNIYGANRSGKTTMVPDALSWLLTGKDAQDREKFDIKNSVHPELNRGEHIVEGEFIKDGYPLTLRRVFKELWVTPRGSDIPELKGNTTDYFINGAAKSQSDYDKFINEIVPMKILKMITNPQFFPSMDWKDQRAILVDMVGEIDNNEVLDRVVSLHDKQDFTGLIKVLNAKQTISDYKGRIALQIKTLKDELLTIPPKIAENITWKPEPINEAEVLNQIAELEKNIADYDLAINDKTTAQANEKIAVQQIKNQIQELNLQNANLRSTHQSEYNTAINQKNEQVSKAESNLRSVVSKISSLQLTINGNKTLLETVKLKKTNMVTAWEKLNAEEIEPFNDGEFICPTCKRVHDAADIEAKKSEMIANFNTDKQNRIDEMVKQAGIVSNDLKQRETALLTDEQTMRELETEKELAEQAVIDAKAAVSQVSDILSVDQRLYQDDTYIANTATIQSLNTALDNRPGFEVNTELLQLKTAANNELFEAKKKLSVKDDIIKIDKRIADLKTQEKNQASKVAELQREIFAIEKFVVAKVDTIEERLQGKFQNIKFKLFDKQMNGGIKETCELVMGGVAYNMLNTEGKLNAGLDIINALCKHYAVYAPIVIDNRESVTDIIPVQSQIINLFVNPEYSTLTVI